MIGYVGLLSLDYWLDGDCVERSITNPSFDDVKACIDDLNANDRTITSLSGLDGSEMVIGGGNGRYVVYTSIFDGSMWNLFSSEMESGRELLVAGGQEGDYDSRQIVGYDAVLMAVKGFYKDGGRDSSLLWEKHL